MFEETFYFMLKNRLFGGKQISYENTISVIFWEEKYTLPEGVDKTDLLQVVVYRITKNHIYLDSKEF